MADGDDRTRSATKVNTTHATAHADATAEHEGDMPMSARVPLVPLARRAILLAAMLLTSTMWRALTSAHVFGPIDAVRNILRWRARVGHYPNGMVDDIPFFSMSSIAFHALTLVVAVIVATTARRVWRAWRRLPREAARAAVDARGLLLDDRVVVAQREIAAVDVATDRDHAFAVVVRSNAGAVLRLPIGSERTAHEIAAALDPAHDRTRIVFDGLTDRRARDMVVAAIGLVSALAAPIGAAALLVHHADKSDIEQFAFEYWILWVTSFGGFVLSGAIAALAASSVARLLRPGGVALDAKAIELGDGEATWRIGYSKVENVEEGKDDDVALALRDGRRVRLRFDAGRPMVERDQFVLRVRAAIADKVTPSHPSAESSGVRVALRGDSSDAEGAETDARDEEEEIAVHPRAGARRKQS